MLAIRIFLLILVAFNVGSNPAIPGIAKIETSDFLNLNDWYSLEFKIFVFFKFCFLIFKYVLSSKITKNLGEYVLIKYFIFYNFYIP